MKLAWKNFDFDFSKRTYIMGVLNVTPDSFSDGGKFYDRGRAIEQALIMEEQGADIIDIGGESTRPGAARVAVKEEIRRVIPVIRDITQKIKIPVSIDTYKSPVAEAAIDAGASIINDISGLRFDHNMAKVVSANKVPVIVMHIKGTPKNMQKNPVYKALMPEIVASLDACINIARDAGIADDMIIIDPGIGFGKTVDHNLEIIKKLKAFEGLEKPILLGPSRKSFIGKMLGDLPVTERLEGTAAAVALGIFNGANIMRVHDVSKMVRVAKIADGIKRA